MLIKIHVSSFFFSFYSSFHSMFFFVFLFLHVSVIFTACSCCTRLDDGTVFICVDFCVYHTFSRSFYCLKNVKDLIGSNDRQQDVPEFLFMEMYAAEDEALCCTELLSSSLDT